MGRFIFPAKLSFATSPPGKKWAGFLLARAGSAGSSSNLVDFQGALAVSFREAMVGFPKKNGKGVQVEKCLGGFYPEIVPGLPDTC